MIKNAHRFGLRTAANMDPGANEACARGPRRLRPGKCERQSPLTTLLSYCHR
jgi:hypothetical protein